MRTELKEPVMETRDPRVKYAYTLSTMPGVRHLPGLYFKRVYQKENPDAVPVVIAPRIHNTSYILNFFLKREGLITGTDIPQLISGEPFKLMHPQAITDAAIKLGVRYSPEMVCFPYKASLGFVGQRVLEFAEIPQKKRQGLYLLLLDHESTGGCIERVYHLTQEKGVEDIVRDIPSEKGYINFDMYAVKDSPKVVAAFLFDLIKLSSRGNPVILAEKLRGIKGLMGEAIERFALLQYFEDRVRYHQSLVASGDINHPGDKFWAFENVLNDVRLLLSDHGIPSDYSSAQSYFEDVKKEVYKLEFQLRCEAEKYGRREKPEAVVGVIGEILHVEDVGRVSGNYGRFLGAQGIYYQKHSGLEGYLGKFELTMRTLAELLASKVIPTNEPKVDVKGELASQGGLNHDVSGHGRETIAYIREEINLRLVGGWLYDGFLELKPFGCRPQNVAENILRQTTQEDGIIYLPWSFDEQAATAGLATRLEADGDLLKRSKIIWMRARKLKGDYVAVKIDPDIGRYYKPYVLHRPVSAPLALAA